MTIFKKNTTFWGTSFVTGLTWARRQSWLYVAVDNLPLIYRLYHLGALLKVYGIGCYYDLLLPGHRLFAQLPVFASGKHFKKYFPLHSQYCSTVYFPTRIVK